MDFLKIKQMVEDGFANKRIAKILILPEKELRHLIKLNGWKIVKETFSENKIEHICYLYEQGVSAKSLGTKYSIDKRRVQKWVNSKGFLRDKDTALRFTFFNQNAFDQINTKETAYWLGFLYADAYNCEITNTVSVSLGAKDFDHLIKLATFLNYPTNEVFYGDVDLEGGKYPTANIKLYSKYLCKVLHDQGCPQAKSLILKFPDWIDKDLQRYFSLGYFDGDGSIKMHTKTKEWRINFCGTKDMLDGINQLLIEQNIHGHISYHSETDNDTWVMDTSGNEQVVRLCEWLYSDPVVYMDRKYNRFLRLKDQQANRKISKTRANYFISNEVKQNILNDIKTEDNNCTIADKYNVNYNTVRRLRDGER